jgi:hypothetical protein
MRDILTRRKDETQSPRDAESERERLVSVNRARSNWKRRARQSSDPSDRHSGLSIASHHAEVQRGGHRSHSHHAESQVFNGCSFLYMCDPSQRSYLAAAILQPHTVLDLSRSCPNMDEGCPTYGRQIISSQVGDRCIESVCDSIRVNDLLS